MGNRDHDRPLTLALDRLPGVDLPMAVAWLLGSCMEAKGKQELWQRQRPEVLEALRRKAVVESVESSNRIEGVTVAADRLRPLILGRSRPRDRPEEELLGYRTALDWIFKAGPRAGLEPGTLLQLHRLSQAGAGDAGCFKERDNDIVEILPSGERRLRFRAVTTAATPAAVGRLCDAFNAVTSDQRVPRLVVIATAVFDLLCIHPFRDGNGRVSRLLTTLLLAQDGVQVGRYLSLERLVEERKDDYYAALAASSADWHQGENDMTPFLAHFLSVLRAAYLELEARVASVSSSGVKSDLVRQDVLSRELPFTVAEVAASVPYASRELVKKVLAELRRQDLVVLQGRGRGAVWAVVRRG